MRRNRLTVGISLVALLTIGSIIFNSDPCFAEAAEARDWSAAEWDKARRLSPLPPPPPSPTKALADDPQAARLGHRLFFDPRLSPHQVSCAACHRPERGLAAGIETASEGIIRTPACGACPNLTRK